MKRSIWGIVLFIASQFVGVCLAYLVLVSKELLKVCTSETGAQLDPSVFTSSESTIYITVLGLFLSEILLFFLLWGIKYFKPSELVRMPDLNILLTAMLLIICATLSFSFINNALDLPNTLEDIFDQMVKSPVGIFSIVVSGPIIEEIVFRRIIINDCMTRFGKPWAAILISAALFGIIHLNPAQMANAFLMGILFGWVYIRTGSMLPGIIGHIINNGTSVLEMKFAENGSFLDTEIKFYQEPKELLLFIACLAVTVLLIVLLRRSTDKSCCTAE